ncbi:hypothetical protein BJV74DRAFT_548184 [Russula compacta]|nr:hypothetical protein BJV74DRAFT_548184 [Russula compacta]
MSTEQHNTQTGGSSGPSSNEAPDIMVNCPLCGKSSRRNQELYRHIQCFHLPRWIWCPHSACRWRGSRVDDFHRHLEKQKCGPIPKEREYQIYHVKMVTDWIKDSESADSILTAQSFAVDLVKERAKELGKNEWLENPWGPGFQEQ